MTGSTIAKMLSGIPPGRCIHTQLGAKPCLIYPVVPRNQLGSIAGLAIPAFASNNPADTLSRIERHRASVLEIDAIVDRIGDLEAILPDDKRLNCAVYHRGVPKSAKMTIRVGTAINAEYLGRTTSWTELPGRSRIGLLPAPPG